MLSTKGQPLPTQQPGAGLKDISRFRGLVLSGNRVEVAPTLLYIPIKTQEINLRLLLKACCKEFLRSVYARIQQA